MIFAAGLMAGSWWMHRKMMPGASGFKAGANAPPANLLPDVRAGQLAPGELARLHASSLHAL